MMVEDSTCATAGYMTTTTDPVTDTLCLEGEAQYAFLNGNWTLEGYWGSYQQYAYYRLDGNYYLYFHENNRIWYVTTTLGSTSYYLRCPFDSTNVEDCSGRFDSKPDVKLNNLYCGFPTPNPTPSPTLNPVGPPTMNPVFGGLDDDDSGSITLLPSLCFTMFITVLFSSILNIFLV